MTADLAGILFDLYALAFAAVVGLIVLVVMGWRRYREIKRQYVNPEWAAFRRTFRR